MEIQLKKSDVKLTIKIGEKAYELKSPKVGHLKLIDAEKAKPEGGDMFKAMEVVLTSMGLPQEEFNDLEVDQLLQIMTGITQMITPKKD